MDSEYKQVIVALDGSEAANIAFQKAVEIAKRNDSRLILTHIIDSRSFATAEAYDRTLSDRAEEDAKKLLKEFAEKAKSFGAGNVTQCIDYGSPKIKIAKDVAADYKADLIICGATGLNAVERFLIGSVSESITRYANCDVLVVR